jgi:hypothetical protein
VPNLSSWAGPLRAASNALIQEVEQAEHIPISGAPAQEQEAMHRALDLPGKRGALIKAVRGVLASAGKLDPEEGASWRPVYRFLKQDADEQWTSATRDRDQKAGVAHELRGVFFGATPEPAGATTYFEKLETMNVRRVGAMPQLLESALAPGQTPMSFLQNDAREFLNAQTEFDRELIRALDSLGASADPGTIRIFNGLYPIWESLERHEDLLKVGAWPASLHLLAEISRSVLLAVSWGWNEFDPDTGKSSSEFAVQRAGQNIDLLNVYMDRWRERGVPEGPLYAAAEVDEDGHRIWTHWSWVLWKWIAAKDLDDLAVDGRVVEALGRRWLLPAGSSIKSIRSLKDVNAADAREIVVVFDPAVALKDARRAAP